MSYRKHRIEVTVDIHESNPVERDAALLESIRKEITDLASGDVVIINTRAPEEV